MTIKLGIVMDPIATIKPEFDGCLAMLAAAQERGWQLYYMELSNLFCRNGTPGAYARTIKVSLDPQHWYDFTATATINLHELDIILMRKDPPFNMEYIYATYLLELAASKGCLVSNNPSGIRSVNEKMFINWFPHCCPPTTVTCNKQRLFDFIDEHNDVIIKPLDMMAGIGAFHVRKNDDNVKTIIETATQLERRFVMAQRFIPEVRNGEKRIFIINGEPTPYAYLRFAEIGDFRPDDAGKAIPLTDRDFWICKQISATLVEHGINFAGIDVIGDYLTEINVTSPSLFRQLEAQSGIKILDKYFAWLESNRAA